MRWTPSLMVALLGALVAAAPVDLSVARAGGRSFRPDTLPVEQIRRGMKGYGLTVFEGTQPERFDVEVIDVMKNYLPAQDIILIKTHHPRLDVVNSVQGMSGSPIFIDGKMVGAYSYGWSFGKEPVAGVTPIQYMVDDIDRPLPKQILGWPLDPLPASRPRSLPGPQALDAERGGNRFLGAPGRYQLAQHAAQVAGAAPLPPGPGLRQVATPLLVGGLGRRSIELTRELFAPLGLEPLQAGGGQSGIEPGSPEHFVDGGTIAIPLIRGDVNATSIGTVTRVEGDRLVAFGHPMLNAGVSALPTAVGRIAWILASQEFSQKVGFAVRPLGALINDRQASIVVSESAKAPVIPVALHVEGVPGAPKHDWSFEIAHEHFMTPSFLAMGLGEALQATGAERQDVSWSAHSTVRVRGYGDIHIEDFGVSIGGTPDPKEFMGLQLVAAVGGILNNPWKPAFVESVETSIQLTYAREIVRLRGARALEPEIEAGQPARLLLNLVPFAGPPIERVITVPLPRHLAGSALELSIRPGHSVLREKPDPENLDDFLRNLEDPVYPPKSIVVSYASEVGVAFKGQVAEQLPPGALDSIRQQAASASPQAFRSERRQVIEIPDFMVGSDKVTIHVRPTLK